MSVLERNNVRVFGHGTQVLMFAHGFGCDQNMWKFVYPAFIEKYKIIVFDHVGAGNSDLSAFEPEKYENLEGYANDIIDIITELHLQNVIFVGHSVSALMGIIASLNAPQLFKSLILVSPSPSYINDGDYTGGFSRHEIDELLESLDSNHLGWSMAMAPVIMGSSNTKELSDDLANSFCRTDPAIASHFARTTFLSDKRELLSDVTIPTLILQCSDDVIAPQTVGEYMHEQIKDSNLVIMNATGHCPNLSAPEETIYEMKKFLS